MAATTVKIQGADRLASTLKAAGRDLGDLEKGNQAAADLIDQEATPRTPFRTGRLAASVRSQAVVGGASIQSSLPYAPVVHWGSTTRHMKAQPWISATVTDNQSAVEDIYLESVQDVCDGVRGA